jgi:hypothetical protein
MRRPKFKIQELSLDELDHVAGGTGQIYLRFDFKLVFV